MRCSSCSFDNPSENKFCGNCGASLKLRCGQCAFENAPGMKFCGDCGTALVEPAAKLPDPRSYTPKHLAEKILTSRSALEGERKQVTVLFADVKGSMELAESVDPEEWHRIMERFFRILTDGVHRFEGTVNQYTGDGIMALFGAPIAHEDHAQRACYAALHLQDELRRYANELRLEKGISFSVRMGINSGEVVVGKIGDDLRMDYTALGHTASLAARMEQIAEPGKAYLSDHTAKLVDGFVILTDLGQHAVKGAKEPIRVYELQGLGRLRTKLEVSRARGFSRFVGREQEMMILEAALERGLQGHGQVVGIVADPGVGKSRLCFELVERWRLRGLTVLEGRAVPHGRNIPYLPMLQLYRAYYGITEHDSDQDAREKVAGRLLSMDETIGDALPIVFDFLGVPDPERPSPRMDPEARQRQIFNAIRWVIQRQGPRQPIVALLEDLHWFDRGSEALLEQWVEAMASAPGLLLLNFRPEYHAGWMQKTYYQQLPLAPLHVEAIGELLHDLLGSDPSVSGLGMLIRECTGGNPFFIEEVVQSLAESHTLEGTKGDYRLARSIETIQIPTTVQVVLAARIDRLPEQEKQVLQASSVIGKSFAEPILRRIADVGEADLTSALEALQRKELVYQEAAYPQAAYAFKHPLTHEVAYRSQLSERRRRLHAAVASAIEELFADRLEANAALLARHREAAGEAREAARWYARAAEWAGESDSRLASHYWEQTRTLVDTLPNGGDVQLRLAATIGLLRMGQGTGISPERVAALFEEGKSLAEASGDRRAFARLCGLYALNLQLAGHFEGLRHYGREGFRIAVEVGDLELELRLRIRLCIIELRCGSVRTSFEIAREGVERAERAAGFLSDPQAVEAVHSVLTLRAFALAFMGRLEDAERDVEAAARIARAHRLQASHGLWEAVRTYLALFRGDDEEATRRALEHRRIAEQTGSSWARLVSGFTLGRACLIAGRFAEARELITTNLAEARRSRVVLEYEAESLAQLAEALSGCGEAEAACATAEEAIALAKAQKTILWELYALMALARARLTADASARNGTIEATLERARSLVEQTEARIELPRIHILVAELARRRGDEALRVDKLCEAHRLFCAMGATGHAARIAKELRL